MSIILYKRTNSRQKVTEKRGGKEVKEKERGKEVEEKEREKK